MVVVFVLNLGLLILRFYCYVFCIVFFEVILINSVVDIEFVVLVVLILVFWILRIECKFVMLFIL